MNDLSGKRILLGVSGGIAAYKLPHLVRLFKKSGAEVQVVMTKSAAMFVSPLALATLSGRAVLSEIFPNSASDQESWTNHIRLGEWADGFVLAPATANVVAKLANGFADDMLSVCFLTLRPNKPKLIFPSMDGEMFDAPAVQRNLNVLREQGCLVIEPEVGELASGLVGKGRLPEPEKIFALVCDALSPKEKTLAGKQVVVTAGATREKIDGVRFISNYSSGKMGFALAEAAAELGAETILITGKTSLPTPPNVKRIDVESAEEMFREATRYFETLDVFVAAAAVADYRPAETHQGKLKKSADALELRLVKNPDILLEFGKRKKSHQLSVGFALEIENALENARAKLAAKNCDIVALNRANEEGAGFESETNRLTLLFKDGSCEQLPLQTKREIAKEILKKASFFFRKTSLTSPER
ncbi:MAG: bifunctional phosphopantothenoylcysteine decarboxylase/phosphopantothenate--cysteine ligase CoaBC [Chloroherpetonaceae bacterium]|nr:bifunctional phosphopantothenoylcysteine decarboxylase/phosphopantothenate--cysteine ligase CoaBC [Chloroherpetonaceae bacterium]MDW8438459.1 bifunctional phosphopantothenoylcysteine decarboxylase/phosphopantothenate--cysteine ligase CoaBC [Chloroherpetonaceae bacterium]